MSSKYEQIIKEFFRTKFTKDDVIDVLYWVKIDHNQAVFMIKDCKNSKELKELKEKQKLLEKLKIKFTKILSDME